jgi:DMSO/TMAO reductase YedYZ molybdopterin-dependent catalytic subunit
MTNRVSPSRPVAAAGAAAAGEDAPLSRRQWLRGGVAAAGVWAMARMSPAAFGLADPAAGDELVPFVDDLPDVERTQVKWHEPLEWVTPAKRIFDVGHYSRPEPIPAAGYDLPVYGLVDKPATLTLEQVKARPKAEVTALLECSGNGSSPTFMGAVANAKWVGTPLAPLLKELGAKGGAVEVAFYGTDTGKEKLGKVEVEQPFARTLPIAEAMRDDVLLCYEVNGEPLAHRNGGPLRLVVPGWYGIAWVKWLAGIEVRDRRLMTRFVAKDYVTLREEKTPAGKSAWRQTSVGPMNVKSIVARVVKRKDGVHVISGAAWTQGTVAKVEIQIDGGPWVAAALGGEEGAKIGRQANTWTFFAYEWPDAKPGEHTIVSRATDDRGRVQPRKDDPEIATKKTYYEAYAQFPRKVKVE